MLQSVRKYNKYRTCWSSSINVAMLIMRLLTKLAKNLQNQAVVLAGSELYPLESKIVRCKNYCVSKKQFCRYSCVDELPFSPSGSTYVT